TWGVAQQLRTMAIAAASILAVVAIRRLVGFGGVDRPKATPWHTLAAAIAGGIVAVGAAGLVLVDPARLTRWASEDGPVEWLSAVFAFAAGLLIGAAAVARLRRATAGPSRWLAIAVLGVAGLSLLIGLEEVSWFQRVLDIESPAAVQGRNQAEFNPPNGATARSENLYYVGGFVFMVAFPGLLNAVSLPGRWRGLTDVLPGPITLYGSVWAAALVYEMWEIVPIQMTFFASLAVLATDRRPGGSPKLGPPVAAIMIVVAAVFLFGGGRMTRSWDDTEVRELLLALGFLLYGIELTIRRYESRLRPLATEPLLS
ncbi:MAG: hypothetical protein AAGK32_18955, partial [Actinomycetota bacterium]